MGRIEFIWNEYSNDLKRFILSKIQNRDIANDILQDVFLKAYLKMSTLKNSEKIKPWLYQIARNTISDHFRKQKFNVDSDTFDVPDENEISKANEQFANCILPHISKLPLKYKEALVKTEFQNYSQLRLADELKISYSGAKSRVQRAKKLLKHYFKECCDISTDKYGNVLSYETKHECKLCN